METFVKLLTLLQMALTQDDLAAIEKLISKATKPIITKLDPIFTKLDPIITKLDPIITKLDPIVTKLDDLDTKMEKVLRCVSHENADFDPRKKKNYKVID